MYEYVLNKYDIKSNVRWILIGLLIRYYFIITTVFKVTSTNVWMFSQRSFINR